LRTVRNDQNVSTSARKAKGVLNELENALKKL